MTLYESTTRLNSPRNRIVSNWHQMIMKLTPIYKEHTNNKAWTRPELKRNRKQKRYSSQSPCAGLGIHRCAVYGLRPLRGAPHEPSSENQSKLLGRQGQVREKQSWNEEGSNWMSFEGLKSMAVLEGIPRCAGLDPLRGVRQQLQDRSIKAWKY